ncbi:hypothetical protein GCM10010247_10900 [Streptomyces calvus]|nr:hypothetical protein GCM10010247_10900 [Streptomyces calvus]
MTVRRSSPCGVPLSLPLDERYDSPEPSRAPRFPRVPAGRTPFDRRAGDQLWWDW